MGKVSFAYYVNWAMYGRKHFPKDVPVESLTHILYAFADVRPDTGAVFLTDTYSDQQVHYTEGVDDPDSWNDPNESTNLYGNLKRFGLLKRKHRNLKLLLSIGGWTYSSHFWPSMSNDEGRQAFADSAVELLENNGFDGIDVDWEYPADATQAAALTQLLAKLREALDAAAAKRTEGERTRFVLSAAVSAATAKIATMDVAGMSQSLDYFNIMAYDYAGSWSALTGHQASLYASPSSTATEASGNDAVQAYLAAGARPNQLVFGLALYGRGFDQTNGLNQPFSGVGAGSFENGVWDLKALPQPGSVTTEDASVGASYSYDASKKYLISYDTPNVFQQKADFIKEKGLAGAMFWETSGDYDASSSSVPPMIPAVAERLGGLESSQNCISYPLSKYTNVRSAFAT